MKRILIEELEKFIGQEVKIFGWVQVMRIQKKMQFVIVRDHTGMVQTVHERQKNDEIAKAINSLTRESAIEVIGTLVANKQVKLGEREIVIKEIKPINRAEPVLPIDERSDLENRLNWRFLDLRCPENLLIFKIQTTIEHAMRSYWLNHGFIEIHSPKLMASASETGAELFRVEYFGKPAYLAQSPQFYKQMAMAAGFDRVFEIGPVFRANPSFTSRHDTEFTSVDMEMSWIESHDDIMRFEERWLQYVLKDVKEKHGEAISKIFDAELIIPALPFPRIPLQKAHEILSEMEQTIPPELDLSPENERALAKHVTKELGHEFVFVTDYPISVRPFYHMRHEDNPGLTKSFDLLWKGLEVTTGAQREHRYEILKKQALEKKLKLEPIQYYLDFFKFGCPPHGGFGFGLTRMLMVMLGLKNVREVTYLYRGPNRLSP